jgi:hypothetical protein
VSGQLHAPAALLPVSDILYSAELTLLTEVFSERGNLMEAQSHFPENNFSMIPCLRTRESSYHYRDISPVPGVTIHGSAL